MVSALTHKDVWVVDDSIISPLGLTSEDNFTNVLNSISGIKKISDPLIFSSQIHAGKISTLKEVSELTRFEQMCIEAVSRITNKHKLPADKTLFILSTTKGNIDLLRKSENNPRIHLHTTANHIAKTCGLKNVLVVSNACISGVMAITVATRYLRNGKYNHALILGADELTSFVVSGFESLGALSNDQCKPFDQDRTGINLGEAAAAILISTKPEELKHKPNIKVLGSGLTNDANHISGPSRTGEELAMAIHQSLKESDVSAADIDFISAHGTATLYNDEMESKAFNLSGLSDTPLNSLKGFYGHTLGAAGIVETIIGIHSLKNDTLVPSFGFNRLGVSGKLNVITKATKKPLKTFLKTASGFGGCNGALIVQKQTQP